MCSSPWSREVCRSSTSCEALIPVSSKAPGPERPKGGNPGQSGEAKPFVCQVQVEQLLASAEGAGFPTLQRQQGWIPDQQSRVGDGRA